MVFDRQTVAGTIEALAKRQIYLGTSSWKYPGWLGQLYGEERYLYRGKVAKSRFERGCLEEYATVFKSVCVDAGYYQFPQPKTIEAITQQVPDDFLFSFKVTEEITIKHFTKLPRYGKRASQENPHFLNAELFQNAFLAPLEAHRTKIGVLIFEFSQFYSRNFERGRDFVEALDAFFGRLPTDWQYGVEIRNQNFLADPYFEMLERHGVAHVYNQWQRMPPVSAQMTLPRSQTADFFGARFLLTPGRRYQEAVDEFSPYESVQVTDEDARGAAARLVERQLTRAAARPSVLYVNDRLEGNALGTIVSVLKLAGLLPETPENPPP